MNVPKNVRDKVNKLSRELNIPLAIIRCWNNEFGDGHHCRLSGVLLDSPLLRIELDGCIAVGTQSDATDISVVVNGQCVAPVKRIVESKAIELPIEEQYDPACSNTTANAPRTDFQPAAYLHREDSNPFVWDDLDEGFFHRIGIDATQFRPEPLDELHASNRSNPTSAAELLKAVAPLQASK